MGQGLTPLGPGCFGDVLNCGEPGLANVLPLREANNWGIVGYGKLAIRNLPLGLLPWVEEDIEGPGGAGRI